MTSDITRSLEAIYQEAVNIERLSERYKQSISALHVNQTFAIDQASMRWGSLAGFLGTLEKNFSQVTTGAGGSAALSGGAKAKADAVEQKLRSIRSNLAAAPQGAPPGWRHNSAIPQGAKGAGARRDTLPGPPPMRKPGDGGPGAMGFQPRKRQSGPAGGGARPRPRAKEGRRPQHEAEALQELAALTEGDRANAPSTERSRMDAPRPRRRPVAPSFPAEPDRPVVRPSAPPPSSGTSGPPTLRSPGMAPLHEFEAVAESESRPWMRQRIGLPPSRERIRVDRMRTDRARLQAQGQGRRQARRAALAQLQRRAPTAFRRGVAAAMPSGTVPPSLLDRLSVMASGEFVQSVVNLLGQADGSASLDTTIFSALIASAVATAATRLGIIKQVNVDGVAKAVNQILASELSPALKVLATAAVVTMSAARPGQREAELLP